MQISENAIKWLASGERGQSSNTLFSILTGVNAHSGFCGLSHPSDPDDFKRCEKLLRQCPELRADLWRMKGITPAWGPLVEHWDNLVELFESEVPGVLDGGKWPFRVPATKTYELMKSLGC
jgi:hypothetical protein